MQHSGIDWEPSACAAGDRTSSTSLGTFARLGGNGVDCMRAFSTTLRQRRLWKKT